MNRGNLLGAIILLGLGGALAVVGYAAHTLGRATAYDLETLCLIHQPLEASTVLLIDKTDPLDEAQRPALEAVVMNLRDRLRRHERFRVLLMGEDGRPEPVPAFDLCSPGIATDADELYENPKLIQKTYDERFGAPLKELLADLQLGGSAPHSPILEAIRDIATATAFSAAVPERRLILFSDMMQNTPAYSHYKTSPDFSSFKDTSYAQEAMTDLTGMVVEVIYLRRPNASHRQGDLHLQFWRDYFYAAGAKNAVITAR